jgi:hypothetical protein
MEGIRLAMARMLIIDRLSILEEKSKGERKSKKRKKKQRSPFTMAPCFELLDVERANQHIQIFAPDDLELRSGTQTVFYSFKKTYIFLQKNKISKEWPH